MILCVDDGFGAGEVEEAGAGFVFVLGESPLKVCGDPRIKFARLCPNDVYLPHRGSFMSKRFALALSLFLIGSLHTMIFAIFQVPENFLMGHHSHELTLACKGVLYVCAIGISFFHQTLCRRIGLRMTLYYGLVCNLLGVSILLLNQHIDVKGVVPLIFLDVVFFGLAITSVINALVTYIIIEFPRRVGVGIVALFAFFNLGAMLASVVLGVLGTSVIYILLIALLLVSLWFVHTYFFTPASPTHSVRLEKGSAIWKELHYRLGLYVIAIVAYGLTETTFSLWGHVQIENFLGLKVANSTIPIFWLFLIVGQIFLLLPLYLFSAKRIFYFLVFLIMAAGYYFSLQTREFGFIVGLAIAGFGCSAVFPILLSMMEKEISFFAQGTHLLYYIEKVVAIMVAGYFLGVGTIDLWVEKFGQKPLIPMPMHFDLAVLFIATTGLIVFFLNKTWPSKHS